MQKEKKPEKENRETSFRGTHFALTIPHFTKSVDEIRNLLEQTEKYLKLTPRVVQEHHKNKQTGELNEEDPHIHVYLIYKGRCRLKQDHFDYLGKHGRIEPVRNYKAYAQYLKKQYGIDISSEQYDEQILLQDIKKDLHRTVVKLIDQGWSVEDIILKYKQQIKSPISLKRNIDSIIKIQKDKKYKDARPGIKEITPELIQEIWCNEPEKITKFYSWPGYQVIIDSINQIPKYKWNRPPKTPSLYILADIDAGKTSLLKVLRFYCMDYVWPSEGYFSIYFDNSYHFISCNEFNLRHVDFELFLQFPEGEKTEVPVKNGKSYKNDNPVMFIMSNYPLIHWIKQRFPNESVESIQIHLAQVEARFSIVELNKEHDLIFLQDLIQPLSGEIKTLDLRTEKPVYIRKSQILDVKIPSDLFSSIKDIKVVNQIKYILKSHNAKTELSLFEEIRDVLKKESGLDFTFYEFNNILRKLKSLNFIAKNEYDQYIWWGGDQ